MPTRVQGFFFLLQRGSRCSSLTHHTSAGESRSSGALVPQPCLKKEKALKNMFKDRLCLETLRDFLLWHSLDWNLQSGGTWGFPTASFATDTLGCSAFSQPWSQLPHMPAKEEHAPFHSWVSPDCCPCQKEYVGPELLFPREKPQNGGKWC